MTDAGGAATERTGYRPYGEEVALQQPLTMPEAKGFIGERFDGDAGLQYLNARYYDPRLGMFVQPDWWEVTEAGVGTNRYAYAFGDPVNGRDPGGHSWLGDAVRDIGRSIRDSFGALGDAVSGNVTRHNNAGQPGTNGEYGVARGLDGTTHGCFGCSGTGIRGQVSIERAAEFEQFNDMLRSAVPVMGEWRNVYTVPPNSMLHFIIGAGYAVESIDVPPSTYEKIRSVHGWFSFDLSKGRFFEEITGTAAATEAFIVGAVSGTNVESYVLGRSRSPAGLAVEAVFRSPIGMTGDWGDFVARSTNVARFTFEVVGTVASMTSAFPIR